MTDFPSIPYEDRSSVTYWVKEAVDQRERAEKAEAEVETARVTRRTLIHRCAEQESQIEQMAEALLAARDGKPLGPFVGAQTILDQKVELNTRAERITSLEASVQRLTTTAEDYAQRVRELEAQSRIDREQCDRMTSEAGEMAEKLREVEGGRDGMRLALLGIKTIHIREVEYDQEDGEPHFYCGECAECDWPCRTAEHVIAALAGEEG